MHILTCIPNYVSEIYKRCTQLLLGGIYNIHEILIICIICPCNHIFRSNRCDKSFQPPLRLEQYSSTSPFSVNSDLSGRSHRRTSPRNVLNDPVWPQKQSRRLDQALRCSTYVKWGPEGATWSFIQEILTSEL